MGERFPKFGGSAFSRAGRFGNNERAVSCRHCGTREGAVRAHIGATPYCAPCRSLLIKRLIREDLV